MESVLCSDCSKCPAVKEVGDQVHIGEDIDSVGIAKLSKEEWNLLVDDVHSGKLHKL